MKSFASGCIALFALVSTPALAAPPSTDCFAHEGVSVGCAALGAYPQGYAPSEMDVRRRVIIDADGTQEPTQVDYLVQGGWRHDAAHSADSSAPQQGCGFLGLGCTKFSIIEYPGSHCSTSGSTYSSRGYGRKYRSQSYSYRCP